LQYFNFPCKKLFRVQPLSDSSFSQQFIAVYQFLKAEFPKRGVTDLAKWMEPESEYCNTIWGRPIDFDTDYGHDPVEPMVEIMEIWR